jgi:hypothetical protein
MTIADYYRKRVRHTVMPPILAAIAVTFAAAITINSKGPHPTVYWTFVGAWLILMTWAFVAWNQIPCPRCGKRLGPISIPKSPLSRRMMGKYSCCPHCRVSVGEPMQAAPEL